MEPKISVVIPVYNVEKYLQTCIDSLLAQTMEDIEFIFVNDASPDNSLEILRRNEQAHPERIRVIDSDINRMQGGARNLGIKAARAPYIGFVDSDDFVGPEMYRKLYDRMMETDADVVYVQAAPVPHDTDRENVNQLVLKPYVQWSDELLRLDNVVLDDQGMQDFIRGTVGGVWTALWKKTLFTENDLYFPEHLRYEDNYWGSLVKPYIRKFAFVREIHSYYRNVPQSTVHSKNAQHHFHRITIENMLLNKAKELGFFEKYHAAWEYLYATRYTFNTVNYFATKFDKLPMKEIRQIKKDLWREFPHWYKNKYLWHENGFYAIFRGIMLLMPVALMATILKLRAKR